MVSTMSAELVELLLSKKKVFFFLLGSAIVDSESVPFSPPDSVSIEVSL